MNDQRKQILEMLGGGKISADEAERLLDVLNEGAAEDAVPIGGNGEKKPKYLHVKVNSEEGSGHGHGNVDIKVPLALLKAGIKLGTLMPERAKDKFHSHLADKGIDLDLKNMDSEKIEQLVRALQDNPIEIESDKESVKIFCS